MPFTIERVTDELAARRWHAVDAATGAADHVGLPAEPLQELLPLLSGVHAGEVVEFWLGTSGGSPWRSRGSGYRCWTTTPRPP